MKKQRKSDGTHISDQPYATSSYRGQAGGPAYENGSSTSGRKRKYPEKESSNGRGDRGDLAPADSVSGIVMLTACRTESSILTPSSHAR